MIFNKRVSARMQGKVYMTVVISVTIVWLGSTDTDEKTGGSAVGGRVRNAAVFVRSDKIDVIRNEWVGWFGDSVREVRLRWREVMRIILGGGC